VRARALGMLFSSTIGLLVHVLEQLLKLGLLSGRTLVCRIRSGASRDRYGDVVWLNFKDPYRHLVVDVATLPSHHVMHDDTHVAPKCRRAGKHAASRHPVWLDLSLQRVLSVESLELSP
jgi:hypothetical protein